MKTKFLQYPQENMYAISKPQFIQTPAEQTYTSCWPKMIMDLHTVWSKLEKGKQENVSYVSVQYSNAGKNLQVTESLWRLIWLIEYQYSCWIAQNCFIKYP